MCREEGQTLGIKQAGEGGQLDQGSEDDDVLQHVQIDEGHSDQSIHEFPDQFDKLVVYVF